MANLPESQNEMEMLVRKLSLWIIIMALSLAVKMLLGLSRFFGHLSQDLSKGIISILNNLSKGDPK
jgi:hypothetical protein